MAFQAVIAGALLMRTLNKIIMTLAGLLLIVAAGLKFAEMTGTCVPSLRDNPTGFWESYSFFLIQIPLEFALGVWMVCGLFRKAAWVAGTLCYFAFIFVTLGKWVTGAESCGCFGQITVDPKITLFAMDIPVFLLLAIFRPKGYKLLPPPWPNLAWLLVVFVPTIGLMVAAPAAMVAFRPDCIKVDDQPNPAAALKLEVYKLKQDLSKNQLIIDELQKAIAELQKAPRTTDKKAFIGVLEVIATEKPNVYEIHIGGKQTLTLNTENLDEIYLSVSEAENQQITVTEAGQIQMKWIEPETTEVTPPATDVNDPPPTAQQWNWLQYVVEDDVRAQLTQGLVVVMMHRFDCPVCEEMAPVYSDYYKDMSEQGVDTFKIAFLAIPPYGDEDHVPEDTLCIEGKLTDEQNWQLMSPVVVLLYNGELLKTWEQGTAPDPESILDEL
jgi:hypothetical protein